MKWYMSWKFWLIVWAVTFAIGFTLAGCQRAEPAPQQPQASSIQRQFKIGDGWDPTVLVTEFRDSAGRVCVLASTTSGDGRGGRSVALSCARPLPPLNYEDLPPVEGEQQ